MLDVFVEADLRPPSIPRPYREGGWVAIPASAGDWIAARIARCHRGFMLLYVFARRRVEPPMSVTAFHGLGADDAVWVGRVTDGGLLDDRWRVVPSDPPWDRDAWPMPVFGGPSVDGESSLRITFHPDDPGTRRETLHRHQGDDEPLPSFRLHTGREVETVLA